MQETRPRSGGASLSWPQRAAMWVGVVAGGSLAILGGRALIDHVRFERDAHAAAGRLDFKQG